jgi:hypothetical protein
MQGEISKALMLRTNDGQDKVIGVSWNVYYFRLIISNDFKAIFRQNLETTTQ